MFCTKCHSEIKQDGIVKNGNAYHLECFDEVQIVEDDRLDSEIGKITGLKDFMVGYFRKNPFELKKAIKNKYFVLLERCGQRDCVETKHFSFFTKTSQEKHDSEIVYLAETANTKAEIERLLKKYVICSHVDGYEYIPKCLIVENKVVEQYSIEVNLDFNGIVDSRPILSTSFGENISRTALLLKEALENKDSERVEGLVDLLLSRIYSLTKDNYLNEERHTQQIIENQEKLLNITIGGFNAKAV